MPRDRRLPTAVAAPDLRRRPTTAPRSAVRDHRETSCAARGHESRRPRGAGRGVAHDRYALMKLDRSGAAREQPDKPRRTRLRRSVSHPPDADRPDQRRPRTRRAGVRAGRRTCWLWRRTVISRGWARGAGRPIDGARTSIPCGAHPGDSGAAGNVVQVVGADHSQQLFATLWESRLTHTAAIEGDCVNTKTRPAELI